MTEAIGQELARQFQCPGDLVSWASHGDGHINATFLATYRLDGRECGFVHQRVNHHVFTDPLAQMDNMLRVTNHLKRRLKQNLSPDERWETLQFCPCLDGGYLYREADGHWWRTYRFVDHAYSLEVARTASDAYQAARAFGRFQCQLADLPGPTLHEVIPHFHHTPRRLAALENSARLAAPDRLAAAAPDLAFVRQRADLVHLLQRAYEEGELPTRVTHNDTKFNNVLLDKQSAAAVCVVDLDTVMHGIGLCDFGDLVRGTVSGLREDNQDVDAIVVQMPTFAALAEGYLDAMREVLTDAEKMLLQPACNVLTLELVIRFLTDYLDGDRYFPVAFPEHNLVRARAQAALLASMERREADMRDVIRSLL